VPRISHVVWAALATIGSPSRAKAIKRRTRAPSAVNFRHVFKT
jgi:hypothetical protein